MSRSPQDVLRELIAISPDGEALPLDGAGIWPLWLAPLASEISLCEASAEGMLVEINPGDAVILLPDYERVLGPDPFGRDPTDLAGRQTLAFQRWTMRGGQSIAFFIGLAASLGVTITIDEAWPLECGEAECGDSLISDPEGLKWLVTLPQTQVFEPECGAIECGDDMGSFEPSFVQTLISALRPASTEPVFSYTG